MAHIDLEHGLAIGRRPPASLPALGARRGHLEEPSRLRSSVPTFCRIDAGQLGRTLFLVMICVSFWSLPQPQKLPPKAGVAAPSLKPF